MSYFSDFLTNNQILKLILNKTSYWVRFPHLRPGAHLHSMDGTSLPCFCCMEMIGFGIAGNGQTCQDAISLSIYRSLRVDDKHSGFLTRVGVIQYYVVYFDEKSKLQQKKDCYYWKCERVLMFFFWRQKTGSNTQVMLRILRLRSFTANAVLSKHAKCLRFNPMPQKGAWNFKYYVDSR